MIKFTMTPHKYALDEITQRAESLNKEKVRLFIDLRNSIPVFFDENATKILLKDPKLSILQFVESVISFMDYITHVINSEVEFVFFYEKGRSEYHKALNKEYKAHRGGSYLILSPDEVEQAKDLNIKCFDALYSMFSEFTGVSVYKLNYFEADFIPHYIINNVDKDNDNITKYLNVILSNDKDMFQSIAKDGSTICLKKEYRKKQTTIVDFDNMYIELIKDKEATIDSDKNFIADILSASGDEADGVKGIKGVGYKTAFKIFKELNLRITEIFEKYETVEALFEEHNELPTRTKTAIKKLYDNTDQLDINLKQVDYDIIKENIPFKTRKGILEVYENSHKDTIGNIESIVDDMLLFESDYSGVLTYLFRNKTNFSELIDLYESKKGNKSSVFDNRSSNYNNNFATSNATDSVLFGQSNIKSNGTTDSVLFSQSNIDPNLAALL